MTSQAFKNATLLRRIFYPAKFGGVGDGTTDDTLAVQGAIDSAYAMGGGDVDLGMGRWLIDSADLEVKQGVQLRGPFLNLGETDNLDYSTLRGALVLNSAYTVRLDGEFASVRGVGIFRKGLTKPGNLAEAGTAVAAFAGTAVTVGNGTSKRASDCYVGHLLVLGFEYAVRSDFNERLTIEYIKGDCLNGIYMKRCYDMNHMSHCHFWPFVTAHQSWTLTGPAGYRRNGAGYYFDDDVDWGQAHSCFAYGYNHGFLVAGSDHVELLNCGADNNAAGGDTTTYGFLINGNSLNAKLIGCKAAAQGQGIAVDLTVGDSTGGVVTVSDCDLWGSLTAHLNLNAGRLLLTSSTLRGEVTSAGLVIASGSRGASVSNNEFDSMTTPIAATGVGGELSQIDDTNVFFSTSDATIGHRSIFDNQLARTRLSQFASNTTPTAVVYRKASGTARVPTVAQANAGVVKIEAQLYDGSAYGVASALRMAGRGAPSAGSTPGGITLATTPSAAAAATDRLLVSEDGHLLPVTDNAYSLGATSFRFTSVWAANGTIQTSDANAKTEVQDSALGLDFICALRPVSYRFTVGGREVLGQEILPDGSPGEILTRDRPGARRHWGLIAQEVKAVCDAAGVDFGGWVLTDTSNPDSAQGLRYDQFVAPLIRAVQELAQRVSAVEDR